MEMDYKIVEEQTDAFGNVVYQRVRFYEGSTTTENELNLITGELVPVTRYRRTALVEEVEYRYG